MAQVNRIVKTIDINLLNLKLIDKNYLKIK
jgi:hypothetical protein